MRDVILKSDPARITLEAVRDALSSGHGILVNIFDLQMKFVVWDMTPEIPFAQRTFGFRSLRGDVSTRTKGWENFAARLTTGGNGRVVFFDRSEDLLKFLKDNPRITL